MRLHLAKQMLDAGQEGDALAVVVNVAEELAESVHPETGIAILKRVEKARRRDRGAKHPSSPAASEAAFRVWLSCLAYGDDLLRPASPPAEEKETTGERDR